MGLTLQSPRVDSRPEPAPGARRRSDALWAPLALAGSVLIGLTYAATAAVVGPWTLPALLVAAGLAAASLARPGVGVAVAFFLTALNPGLAGQTAWVYGAGWGVLLFALLVLRPGVAADGPGRLPPLGLPVLVYGVAVLGAFAASPATDLGLPIVRSTLTGVLLFLVAGWSLRTRSDVTTALLGLSGAAVITGGLACLQQVVGASTSSGFITSTGSLVSRVAGGFNHPNQLGGFLVLLVPLTCAAALIDRRGRLVHLAGLVLAVGGISASFSRGALLALVVTPLVLLRGRWLLLLAPAAVLALGVGVPSVMTERFALGGQEGAEIAGRRDIWSAASSIWAERPLLGTGLGGFPGTYAEVRVPGKQFLANTQFEPPPHAHNLGLQLLAEQGLVGFTAFSTVAALAARHALRLRRSADRFSALLGGALLASLLGLLVHNLFDVTVLENGGVLLWGVLGLLSAVVALDRAEQPAPDA